MANKYKLTIQQSVFTIWNQKKNSLYQNIISITGLTQIKLMSNQQFIKMKYILFFPRDIEFKIEIAILFETYY